MVILKKIIRIFFIISLVCFSFFYTDKVVEVIRENDSLMLELKEVEDLYKVEAVDGVISDDTIITIYGIM